MKHSAVFYWALSIIFFAFNFARGQNCGGVLSRNSGRFEYIQDEPREGNCIWFIQVSRGQSISLTLEKLTGSGDKLNVYPESDLNNKWPITLTSSDIDSPVNLFGNTLLLIWPGENSGRFSISWRSDLEDGNSIRSSTVNQVQSDRGGILWEDFEPGTVTSAWLDLSLTPNREISKSLSLTLSKEFPSCSRPDPCDCNSLSFYEISDDGFLLGLDRLCGRPVTNYTISKLPPRTIAHLFADSPVRVGENSELLAKEFLEINWRAEIDDPPEPTTTTTTTTTEPPPEEGLKCPKNETIFPCTCVKDFIVIVECNGENVTQESLNNLFFQLRALNDLPPDQTLQFYSLTVRESPMTQLDLTPFMNIQLDSLNFFSNANLTSIVGPPTPSLRSVDKVKVYERSIRVNVIWLASSPLTDQGFGDTLKYFHTSLTRLYFEGSLVNNGHYPIGDGSGDLEFLPGLSAFTNLQYLSFRYSKSPNKIDISGGQFKRQTRLNTLVLGFPNLTYGDDAFLFDEPPPQMVNTTISIDFSTSRTIRNADFDNVTRLTSSSRPITLDFYAAHLDLLSEGNFKAFLLAHAKNKIDLLYCDKLVCDERMKWLKDNPDVYRPQVLCEESRRCACSNDPEKKTIWETDLIP